METYRVDDAPDQERPFILPRYADELKAEFNPRVYQLLPPAMRKLFEPFNDCHERDILLLGVLTVLSGCMPNVRGLYDRRWVSPNLYSFIEAPAGAGKGVLNWARLVGSPIHSLLREETRLAREQYEQLRHDRIRQKAPAIDTPVEPGQRMLFIPVNNSASSVVQTLADNQGAGILFSTEADTLANALAQDWGNFSDILRCAFHHEPIDLQRRIHREYIHIEHPRVSVLLTGTRGQLLRLIPDTENGLFSRFMYYSFPVYPHFRDVFSSGAKDHSEMFRSFGHLVLEMYQFLQAREHPLIFKLHRANAREFVSQFSRYIHESYEQVGTPLLATVHRLGLIGFRISMVLTMLRYFSDPGRKDLEQIGIWQIDFAIAMDLVEHFFFHATVLHADMKDGSRQVTRHSRNRSLWHRLPDTFSRAEATELARAVGISTSTLSRYLVSGQFERIGQGQYRKRVNSESNDHVSK